MDEIKKRDAFEAILTTDNGDRYYEGYETGFRIGAAERQRRMLGLGLFLGFWLGVVVMVVSSALAVVR